jgi:hypothetical protein
MHKDSMIVEAGMKKFRSCIVFASCLALAGRVSAYNADHGPFADDAIVQRISLKEMAKTVEDGVTGDTRLFRFAAPTDPETQLLAHSQEGGFHVELVRGGKTLFPKTRFSDFNFDAGIEAHVADLNGDGKLDFMVYSYSGGCGLASGYCDIAFLLSGQDGYRLTTVMTLWPDAGDYVVLSGKPCFIHTSFDGVEECKDGKQHNFWIYNILVIDEATMRLDNRLASGFPRTIWYTHKPNHKETTIVTDTQKAKLIRESQKAMFRPQ